MKFDMAHKGVVVFLLTFEIGFAQVPAGAGLVAGPDETTGTVGLSQNGSVGLFTHSSPEVLSAGQFAAGVFYNSRFGEKEPRNAFPLSLAFGVSSRIEVSAMFLSLESTSSEHQSQLGMKVNVFNDASQDVLLATDFRLQRVERSIEDIGTEEGMGYSLRLVGRSRVTHGVNAYASAGYALRSQALGGNREAVLAGGGVSVPVHDFLLLGAEVQTGENMMDTKGIQTRFGGKVFLFQHLQIALGVQLGRPGPGVFFGISFSSEGLHVGRGAGNEGPVLLPEPPPLDSLPPTKSSYLNKNQDDGNDLPPSRLSSSSAQTGRHNTVSWRRMS